MNTFDSLPSASSDAELLDLLVDGELSELQRRELLLKLEHDPAAWRRCALAFLEAQQWRREFGAVATAPHPVVPVVVADRTPWWNVRVTGPWLTLAASLLLAFGLGLASNQFGLLRENSSSSKTSLVGNPATVSTTSEQLAGAGTTRPRSAVTLVVDDGAGGPASPVQVPLVEGVVPDARWLQGLPAGLPPDLRRLLELHGHQVRQHRQLVPVQLDDGRQGIVPMDRIEIQPVSARAFQ